MFIDLNDPQLEGKLRAREQDYNRLRGTGQEAPARILRVTDTGVRIGDTASMLQFAVEVFPKGAAPFQADTQQAVLDASRPKFAPDDLTQVAVDHTPIEAPESAIKCPSCGATQMLTEGQAACNFIGSPLKAG